MILKLREWMDKRGISQAQLAKGVGVSTPSVNAWLEGKMRQGKRTEVWPDYGTLERLCIFLGAMPHDLLELEPDKVNLEKTWKDFASPSKKA